MVEMIIFNGKNFYRWMFLINNSSIMIMIYEVIIELLFVDFLLIVVIIFSILYTLIYSIIRI